MSQRESNLLWLKAIFDQLQHSRQQLAYAEDPNAIALLTENMMRDLDRGRRLCEEMQRRRRFRSDS